MEHLQQRGKTKKNRRPERIDPSSGSNVGVFACCRPKVNRWCQQVRRLGRGWWRCRSFVMIFALVSDGTCEKYQVVDSSVTTL